MFKRLFALSLAACLLLPNLAAADDTAPSTDPASSATSAGLGPQSTTDGSGSSSADSAALQPAGTNPIQSSTTDSAGLGAPSQPLQAPASSSDTLQVLSNEADGAPQDPSDTQASLWTWLAVAFVLVLVLLGAIVIARDRRRFASFEA